MLFSPLNDPRILKLNTLSTWEKFYLKREAAPCFLLRQPPYLCLREHGAKAESVAS